jgi:cell division initiation protein
MGAHRWDAQETRFERKRRGYDRVAVDAYVERVQANYEEVWREREQLSERLQEVERELDAYRALEQRVGNTMLVAEGAANEIRDRAAAESDEILAEARLQADEIVTASRTEYDRIRDDVERLLGLRAELASGCKAFLLSGLEFVEKFRGEQPGESGPGAAETDTDEPGEDEEIDARQYASLGVSPDNELR